MSGRVDSDAVKHGLNRDIPNRGLNDDDYYVCWNCGFHCNTVRDAKFPKARESRVGDGIQHPDNTEYDASDVSYDGTDDTWDGTVSYDGHRSDFRVVAGCPFCGCLHYDHK